MEDALLFQAQARRPAPCGRQVGQAPSVGRVGSEGPHHRTLLFTVAPSRCSSGSACSRPWCITQLSTWLPLGNGYQGGGPGVGVQVGGMAVGAIPDCGFEGWGKGNWECIGW